MNAATLARRIVEDAAADICHECRRAYETRPGAYRASLERGVTVAYPERTYSSVVLPGLTEEQARKAYAQTLDDLAALGDAHWESDHVRTLLLRRDKLASYLDEFDLGHMDSPPDGIVEKRFNGDTTARKPKPVAPATKTLHMADGSRLDVIPPDCTDDARRDAWEREDEQAIALYSDPALMSEVHPGAAPWFKMDTIGGPRKVRGPAPTAVRTSGRKRGRLRYRLGLDRGPYSPRFRDQLRHGFRIPLPLTDDEWAAKYRGKWTP